jgi:hypothetical protein
MELDEGQVTVFKTGDIQNNAAPYIMGYDLTDGNEISAALTVDFAKQAEIYGSVGVVTGIADVSFDGGAAKKIYAVKDGEKVDFILPEDVLAENRTELEFGNIPRKGDIIEYALDEAGAAAQIAIVFRLSIAKNYMPDFDGDGTADVDSPSVNFYTDSADAANTVKYYYGLAAAQTAGTRFSKIQVNLDDEIISDNAGYISKLPITAMLAANENTNIYNYSENNPNCIKNIRFSDIIVDPTRLGDRRTGDLVFIKTVNGLATDIITVNP